MQPQLLQEASSLVPLKAHSGQPTRELVPHLDLNLQSKVAVVLLKLKMKKSWKI